MTIARSRVTAQGQISVPIEIRRKLGIGPGSVLEWDEEGAQIVVRRAGSFTFEEVHRKLFPGGPPKKRSLDQLKEGIRQHVRKHYARD